MKINYRRNTCKIRLWGNFPLTLHVRSYESNNLSNSSKPTSALCCSWNYFRNSVKRPDGIFGFMIHVIRNKTKQHLKAR
jgi:hypothetical protein